MNNIYDMEKELNDILTKLDQLENSKCLRERTDLINQLDIEIPKFTNILKKLFATYKRRIL